jgi:hypothetical protein
MLRKARGYPKNDVTFRRKGSQLVRYEGEYSSGNVMESEMASSWEDAKEDCDKDKYEISC